jgi:hypothetical protein
LKVKNRVCHISLLEDGLIFLKLQNRLASPNPGEKGLGVEPVTGELPHGSLLCSDEPALLG